MRTGIQNGEEIANGFPLGFYDDNSTSDGGEVTTTAHSSLEIWNIFRIRFIIANLGDRISSW